MSGLSKTRQARRRVGAVVAAVLLVTGLTTLTATQVSAAPGPTIVGKGSGRCLDVVGNSQAAGAKINIYDCNGQPNQAWTLTAAGELRIYGGTKCLDVVGRDTTAPAALQIWDCNGGTNQQWRFAADASLVGVQSGLCVDVVGASTANSAAVGLWTCNRQTNQQWSGPAGTGESVPPSIPGSPRVSNLTCSSVTFSWNASTDNVGVAYYDVFHDGQLIRTVGASTLTTSLPVVAGATWGLYVNARDAAGNVSQASTTVLITPPPCAADNQAPTVPGNLRASASGTTVTLDWNASTDNIAVKAYDIYRDGVKRGAVTSTIAGVAPGTSFIDSGLTGSTRYSYAVVARDAQANESARSTAVTVTTGTSCANPVCGVTQIGTDTDIPWGLVTLPDGSILYSRRDAHDIVRLNPSTGVKTTVGTVPNVSGTDGEGGLLGLAIAPSFASDPWLYVMHTSPGDNRIVRFRLNGDRLDTGSEQILISGILRNKFHNGGRLRFGPDGKLYASTGDAQNGDNAQNRNNLNGKVLRLNPDGGVPSDNPFGNYVWSYGHRNPQGLAFDSQGRLWEQEFGNGIMDETNLVTRGGNYGWPACEGTSGTCGTAGYIAPKRTYPTGDGSCSGIAIVRDALYVACERGTRLYREVISGTSLTNVTTYYNGTYGRLRTVEPAPGGNLWLTTSNFGDKDSTADNSNEKLFRVTLGQ